MTNTAINAALEEIYTSMRNDNQNLDTHILTLKNALKAQNTDSVDVDPTKLAQPNRQGRKMMQSYFKQRGVIVNFSNNKA